MPATNQRINVIDYSRAIAIIAVLTIHAGFTQLHDICMFIIPTFFIISGCTYTKGKFTFKQYALQRFKRLMIPYWSYLALFGFLEMFRSSFVGYSDYRVIVMALLNGTWGSGLVPVPSGLETFLLEVASYKTHPGPGVIDCILPTDCHLWFLPAMFTACMLAYPILENKKHHNIVLAAATVIYLALGGLETFTGMFQFPYGFGRGCIGAAFMLFGSLIKDYDMLTPKSPRKLIPAFLISALFIGISQYTGTIGNGYVVSFYGPYQFFSVFLLYLGGIGTSYVAIQLFRLLDLIPFSGFKKCLATVGIESMTVYSWQFIAFTIMDIIFIALTDAKVEPDTYYMTLVSPSHWIYKIAMITVTTLVLTYIPRWFTKNIRKKEVSC
ncbi:MAG: acyltransferase [Clostridiales bacterium]|nr:acyltransferase [Clostridiales bacterium]